MQASIDHRSPTLDNSGRIPSGITTPLQHLLCVCPSLQNNVIVSQKRITTGQFESKACNAKNVHASLEAMSGTFDLYFTPNEFFGRRETSRLAALNAFYIDIDAHSVGDKRNPTDIAQAALSQLRHSKIPEPNLIVYTGRGCHFYWLFHRTHKNAVTRWYRVQETLCNVLNGDPGAKDVARVLRLVGTRNSLAPKDRLTATCETINSQRYDFDWLCDQILPFTREQLRELKAKREANKLARDSSTKKGSAPKRPTLQGSIWQRRCRDLLRIAQANFSGGGLPEGKRNRILFLLSSCMAWLHPSTALYSAVGEAAAALAPSYSPSDVRSSVSSVVKRAERDASKEMKLWNGKQVPHRYVFRSKTLWNYVRDLVEPHNGLLEQLEAIVPGELLKERKRIADKARDRVAEGRYKQHKTERDAERSERVQKAHQLAGQGKCVDEIAEFLAVTCRTVRNYLKTIVRGFSGAVDASEQVKLDAPDQLPTTQEGNQPSLESIARSLWWAKPGLLRSCALSTSRDGLGASMTLFSGNETPISHRLDSIFIVARKKMAKKDSGCG